MFILLTTNRFCAIIHTYFGRGENLIAGYVWIKISHRSEQLEIFNPVFSSTEAVNEDKMTYYDEARKWADNIIGTYETAIKNNQNKLDMLSNEKLSGQRRFRQKIEHLKKCVRIFQEGLDNSLELIDRYLSQKNFQYIKYDLV